MEHRNFPRASVAMPVQIQKDGASYGPFATGDVSLEGVFVHSGMVPAKPHEVMTLRMWLPGTCGGRHEVCAAVVHRRPSGLGFLFVTSDRRFTRDLRRFLRGVAGRAVPASERSGREVAHA